MSTNHVTISTPRVHTLQVTVRALRIGTKQVTQSVFRQLPQRSVWDPMTGTLHGQPWGAVNYFWGDCATGQSHLHVVWQDGERLYRDCVYEPTRSRPEGVWRLQERIEDLDQVLHQGALFILALWIFQQGWTLDALTPPKQFRVLWPCGVHTTITVPTQAHGHPDLGDALFRVLQARNVHSVEYRPRKHESSNAQRKPLGEDWTEHLPHQNDIPQYHWTRYREETQQEYVERRQEELAKVYDALQGRLTLEAKAKWDLLDATLPDVETAKQAIDHLAEQWRLCCAELVRLQQQFLTVYAQLTELDQLFIAV